MHKYVLVSYKVDSLGEHTGNVEGEVIFVIVYFNPPRHPDF